VGPNPTFLRYIDQVLPSLGETGAELSTASGLYKGAQPVAAEPVAAARLKGDPRMARFIHRAVRQRERPLRRTAEVPFGRLVLTLTPQASAEIVNAAKRRSGGHNAKRRLVERLLWEHFAGQLERRGDGRLSGRGSALRGSPERRSRVQGSSGPSSPAPPPGAVPDAADGSVGAPRPGTGAASFPGPGEAGLVPGAEGTEYTDPEEPVAGEVSPSELAAELRRRPEVADILERVWPRLTAEIFLHDLYGSRPLLELAGKGLFSAAELDLLYRPRSDAIDGIPWAPADIALLDEANWLLGPVRSRPGAEQRSYGHIVVDEVQDLSPMELRMVGRRSLSGSMTLVGDIAQATGYWAPASWEDLMAYLPARRGWRLTSLSVSYRAPAEVMALAAHVLAAALPGSAPPEPVRQTGRAPRVLALTAAGAGDAGAAGDGPDRPETWHALVAGTVREELEAVSAIEAGEDGSVGVLVPSELLADTRTALVEGGMAFGEVGSGALDTPVSLLALGDAKGLEFDAVVVVEPARIVAQPPEGLRALYVAVTRCTRRLAILHRDPLPAPLQLAVDENGAGGPTTAGPSPGPGSDGPQRRGNGAGEEP
jgi:UvrD-like helicase C-terminal domain